MQARRLQSLGKNVRKGVFFFRACAFAQSLPSTQIVRHVQHHSIDQAIPIAAAVVCTDGNGGLVFWEVHQYGAVAHKQAAMPLVPDAVIIPYPHAQAVMVAALSKADIRLHFFQRCLTD